MVKDSYLQPVIVFSNTITNRLKYITDFIGKEICGKPFHLTTDIDEYKNATSAKINYSNIHILENEYWINPHSLLFEKSVQQQSIDCFEINNYRAFLKTDGDFSFDVFAASFYLMSRYEEYLPHTKDMYGRYAHENSLAFKEKFLDKPLINIWLKELKASLRTKFPSLTTHQSRLSFLPTYDIDEAFSYKHKQAWRNAGGAVKNLLKGEFGKFSLRRKVLNDKLQDPFDSYEWMDNLHRKYELKPMYFFLVAEKTGKYDKNILLKETALQNLIKQHDEKYEIGIHPSWQSGDDPSLIKKEILSVENITGKKISASRQHFIRFTLPQTFRYLIEAGIYEDFSIGYGSINGFRASVASTFYWYDLEKDETTNLLLYPFCYMEANSFFEQKYSPAQALQELQHYYKEVKAVEGLLITIWHNTFLGTDKLFEGWKEVYEEFIKSV